MSVRSIIILLAPPLFLLLAAVNSLLLYREETRDMEAGLRGQALAAAVTVAEFARVSPDPFTDLATASRLSGMKRATSEIVGLEALYLAGPDGRLLNFLAAPVTPRQGLTAPARAKTVGGLTDHEGHPVIVAVAPAGDGRMVVADIDARPLAARVFHLKRLSLALIAGAVALALLLGLVVARRVARELRRTHRIIGARGTGGDDEMALSIREVRDLADAVGLIDKSVSIELDEIARTKTAADPAIGIAAVRARHFPDVVTDHDGVKLSIRGLRGAPAGSFHLWGAGADGLVVIIGEVEGEPATALAGAVALKSWMEATPPEQLEARIVQAGIALGIGYTLVAKVGGGGSTSALLALKQDRLPAFEGYAAQNPALDAAALATDLAILYPDAGIIVAARPI